VIVCITCQCNAHLYGMFMGLWNWRVSLRSALHFGRLWHDVDCIHGDSADIGWFLNLHLLYLVVPLVSSLYGYNRSWIILEVGLDRCQTSDATGTSSVPHGASPSVLFRILKLHFFLERLYFIIDRYCTCQKSKSRLYA